jgi:hypothetical protein
VSLVGVWYNERVRCLVHENLSFVCATRNLEVITDKRCEFEYTL